MTDLIHVDARRFKELAAEGKADGVVVRKPGGCVDKGVDAERRTASFVFSTGAVDRDGDTIDPKGWDLRAYKRNPVVLWAHDYAGLPIGKALTVRAGDGALRGAVRFVDAADSDFADKVFRLVQGGFLNAASVGFLPTAFEMSEDAGRAGVQGRAVDFRKQALLEVSIVPVPSNPEALIEARSKGLDVSPVRDWLEWALDTWERAADGLVVPRAHVEACHKAARADAPGRKQFEQSDTEPDAPASKPGPSLAAFAGIIDAAVADRVQRFTGSRN